ncbi:hypothetical protein MOY_11297 [Halomonas sp. GFAJ-1]|nr:hypothetical protein MOY_11297 [Halomonas sp. GFAJ-1]
MMQNMASLVLIPSKSGKCPDQNVDIFNQATRLNPFEVREVSGRQPQGTPTMQSVLIPLKSGKCPDNKLAEVVQQYLS